MTLSLLTPAFSVGRNEERCIRCGVCVNQCINQVHHLDEDGFMWVTEKNCVGCHRCAVLCPTQALTITRFPLDFRPNQYWSADSLREIYRQAESGGVLLTGMGNPRPYRSYFDHLLLNASQVTNPSIDPLREPMELTTYLGDHSAGLSEAEKPLLKLEIPVMFSAMSYGAVSLNVQKSLARAAREMVTYWNTGEGGLHDDLKEYADCTIVQVASGRFGVSPDYLNNAAAIEIKIGQGQTRHRRASARGKGFPGVAQTRMIPAWSDAISPAPHHDIYSIEDLAQLIETIKVATDFQNRSRSKWPRCTIYPPSSGIVRAGADIVAIDGFRGLPGLLLRIRDNIGIPIEMAIAQVDQRLRDEGIRPKASLVSAGGIRNSADVVKILALGLMRSISALLHWWPWAATSARPALPGAVTGALPLPTGS